MELESHEDNEKETVSDDSVELESFDGVLTSVKYSDIVEVRGKR